MENKKLMITDTILRDAHQSHAATRMRFDEMEEVLPLLDEIGYYSLEAWGGATFDSCLRFLNEDPWDRLKNLKKYLKKTPIQMLLRGQNLLGYRHYADDVVECFIDKSIENGVGVIRVFDALNDPRNLETSIKAIKKYSNGGKCVCEAAISYTTSPVHNTEYFVKLAKQLEDMGADNICIKDMANLLLPYTAYELVSKIKDKVKIPVHLHTHNTAGTGDMVNMKAIEAGCDIVDTALSPLGNGTSQPATEALVASLKGTEYDTGLDLEKLNKCTEYFRKIADRLTADGFLNPRVLKVDVNALIYQVPGGMLSNLISQLKQQNASDRLTEVLEEVPRVRADLGFPPLVTPSSQIVGTQAVLNVLAGERYKTVTKETKGVLAGEYGKLPLEPSANVVKKIIGDTPRITCRPADNIPPELDKYKKEIEEYATCDEDVLTYALLPQLAMPFFKKREARLHGVDKVIYDADNKVQPV